MRKLKIEFLLLLGVVMTAAAYKEIMGKGKTQNERS